MQLRGRYLSFRVGLEQALVVVVPVSETACEPVIEPVIERRQPAPKTGFVFEAGFETSVAVIPVCPVVAGRAVVLDLAVVLLAEDALPVGWSLAQRSFGPLALPALGQSLDPDGIAADHELSALVCLAAV